MLSKQNYMDIAGSVGVWLFRNKLYTFFLFKEENTLTIQNELLGQYIHTGHPLKYHFSHICMDCECSWICTAVKMYEGQNGTEKLVVFIPDGRVSRITTDSLDSYQHCYLPKHLTLQLNMVFLFIQLLFTNHTIG